MKVTLACMATLIASAGAFHMGFFGAPATRAVFQSAKSTSRVQPAMLFGGGNAGGDAKAAGGDKKGEGFNMGNMMEGLKKANEIGQKTKDLQKQAAKTWSSVVLSAGTRQDLEDLKVEGTSEDGKVKVTVTGQQMPVSCEINPDLLAEGAEAVQEKVAQAMSKAHMESLTLMSKKLAELYQDMGLPLGQQPGK